MRGRSVFFAIAWRSDSSNSSADLLGLKDGRLTCRVCLPNLDRRSLGHSLGPDAPDSGELTFDRVSNTAPPAGDFGDLTTV